MRSLRSVVALVLTQLAIGASLTVAVPPSGAVASIAIAPAAITADCSIDVSAALNAWIASVPDNSTLSFAPDGCYRIDRTLIVSKRTGLTFEGNNATFRQVTDGTDINHPRQARTRAGWLFLLSAQLTVRNLTMRRPTLDDVFLELTGGHLGESDDEDAA